MPIAPTTWQVIRDQVSEYLTPCSICGGTDWDLQESLLWRIRQHRPGDGIEIGDSEEHLGVISLTCQTCKHIVLFNAMSIMNFHKQQQGDDPEIGS